MFFIKDVPSLGLRLNYAVLIVTRISGRLVRSCPKMRRMRRDGSPGAGEVSRGGR